MKTIMTQEPKILRVSNQEAQVRVTKGESIYVSKAEYKKAYPERKGPAETKGKR